MRSPSVLPIPDRYACAGMASTLPRNALSGQSKLRNGGYKPAQHELGWADYQMRSEPAIVRHWQLVLLAFTFSLLVGAVPGPSPSATSASPTAIPPVVTSEHVAGGTIRPRLRGAGRLERHAAPSAGVALPVGTPAGVLATLVAQRPTARIGRAPRPRRQRPPA